MQEATDDAISEVPATQGWGDPRQPAANISRVSPMSQVKDVERGRFYDRVIDKFPIMSLPGSKCDNCGGITIPPQGLAIMFQVQLQSGRIQVVCEGCVPTSHRKGYML